jgi:hypothetical protein
VGGVTIDPDPRPIHDDKGRQVYCVTMESAGQFVIQWSDGSTQVVDANGIVKLKMWSRNGGGMLPAGLRQ